MAREFVEFVDLKGFLGNYVRAVSATGKLNAITKTVESIKGDMENVRETELTTLRVCDIGFSPFDWEKTIEGPNFWCLMERDWQDHIRFVLFPIYEELGLLEEIEND